MYMVTNVRSMMERVSGKISLPEALVGFLLADAASAAVAVVVVPLDDNAKKYSAPRCLVLRRALRTFAAYEAHGLAIPVPE